MFLIHIVVEPDSAACVLESIKTGKIEKIDIKRESLWVVCHVEKYHWSHGKF